MRNKLTNKIKQISKKERIEFEKQFLGSLLHSLDMEYGRKELSRVKERYPNITWRHFSNNEHQVLWRAIEQLDFAKDMEERVEKIINDSGLTSLDFNDNRGAIKDIYKKAEGLAWVEHELDAARALPWVGGKMYIKKIYEMFTSALADIEMDSIAKELGFTKSK